MTKLQWLLLATSTFFVVFFFSLVTHPFEVPDEQSHYASVHYLVNEGQMPILSDHSNLSLEEERVERLLGIMSGGLNRYSYHPEFRLEYVPGLFGLHELEIKSLNTPDLRNSFSIHQAAIYPPLYYSFASLFYRLVAGADILTRLFVTRISSVVITTLTALVAYSVGTLIFAQKSYGLTLAFMFLAFPMTVYVGSGVSSDNHHNLLFATFLYYCFKLIKNGWHIRDAAMTGLIIGLDILTKPQALVMFPILLVAIILRGEWQSWRSTLKLLFVLIITTLVVAGWYRQPQYLDTSTGLLAESTPFGTLAHFQSFVREYFSLFTGAMLVWYWGVFKWFGVVLPRAVWWVANRILIVAAIGIVWSFWRDFRRHQLSVMNKIVLFSILANLGYLAALLWFDWQFYQQIGRSLGMQARYFLPLLTTQLFLILHGLVSWGWSQSSQEFIRRLVIILYFILHLAGLYTMVSSYYDLLPLSRLVEQISQYKVSYAKGNWWYLWFSLYFAGIISLCSFAYSSSSRLLTKPKSSPLPSKV